MRRPYEARSPDERKRDSGTTKASGARLELRALSKAFGTAKAVDQVSLQIPAGAFVSLLGPSGSGKTTMLNLIAGFLSADSGEILLDGASISAVPPHRRNIGMVFQSYSLFPHMSVAENVRFPLRMRSALSRSAARARQRDADARAACASRRALSAPALGRAAAAGRHGARARLPSAAVADGRAARCAGQEAARADAGRDQAHSPQRRHHRALRHPRPGGGPEHVRCGRRDASGAYRTDRPAALAL